ncbi:MAG: hypothetical protein L0G02_08100 [Lactococcus lactis]|nr:hypothetical protein [Lactococcus lactis]
MKVKDLKINQEVTINGFKYSYKGVNKVRMSGYTAQKVVFKCLENETSKHFDLPVGNKELKEIEGRIELK